MNKTFRSLLSLAIVFMLMVVLAIPAFAAPDGGTEPQQEITYAESKKLKLVKNFLMPDDFDIHDFKLDKDKVREFCESLGEEYTDELYEEAVKFFNEQLAFEWKIKFISYNGNPLLPEPLYNPQTGFNNYPSYGYYEQAFPYGSAYFTDEINERRNLYYDMEMTTETDENKVKNEKIIVDSFFRNHNERRGYIWQFPGQYIYEFSEYTDSDHQDVAEFVKCLEMCGIDLKYSKAKYRVYLNVVNQLDEDGNVVYRDFDGVQGFPYCYVEDIVIEVITPDNESQKAGDKVDSVTFTNSIVQSTVNVDPEDPDTYDKTLVLKKNVTGKYGDYGKEFTFDFKVDKPEVPAAEATTAKATKIDRDGNKLGDYEFTYGQGSEVKLKAGETLVFTDVYYGATWSFDEQGVTNGKTADGYTVTRAIKSGGTDADPADGEYIVKIAGENSHVFTNDKSEIETPTGVLIDNLPYIIIFAITAGGIILFLAMKRRRRKNEE